MSEQSETPIDITDEYIRSLPASSTYHYDETDPLRKAIYNKLMSDLDPVAADRYLCSRPSVTLCKINVKRPRENSKPFNPVNDEMDKKKYKSEFSQQKYQQKMQMKNQRR